MTSRIMPRTTLNIDTTVLRELKRRGRREDKSVGQIASELLAGALAAEPGADSMAQPFSWASRPMGARVDLDDKEALHAALESE